MASAMTTTLSPADRQAFIQALRDDPVFREEARALLLSREVLELPEKLAQLTDRVDRFIAAQESFNAEQRQFNDEMRQFRTEQQQFNAEQRQINSEQRGFNDEMRQFRAEQLQFNAEQRQFNQTVDARFANIDRFIENQEQFNAEQRQFNAEQRQINERVDARLDNMDRRLGQALGDTLEAKLERSIGPILARTFGLYDVHTLQSRFTMPNQEFNRRLAQAQAEGKITAEQAFQLDRADYIVYGRQTADDAEVYFVAEVSWTLGQNDIIRARERADLMAAASGGHAIAVAIAQEIPPPQVQQAATAQVTLIHDDGN